MICYCGAVFVSVLGRRLRDGREVPSEIQTLVGYSSPPGHTHDDNCLKRIYRCANDHDTVICIRRRCNTSGCDWVGKDSCFCHTGKKSDMWPTVSRMHFE